MKRLFGALLVCGFLAASVAQAAIPPKAPKAHAKVAHKQVKKAKKQNAKARKAAKAHKAPVQKSN
jgi:hypothetical protein